MGSFVQINSVGTEKIFKLISPGEDREPRGLYYLRSSQPYVDTSIGMGLISDAQWSDHGWNTNQWADGCDGRIDSECLYGNTCRWPANLLSTPHSPTSILQLPHKPPAAAPQASCCSCQLQALPIAYRSAPLPYSRLFTDYGGHIGCYPAQGQVSTPPAALAPLPTAPPHGQRAATRRRWLAYSLCALQRCFNDGAPCGHQLIEDFEMWVRPGRADASLGATGSCANIGQAGIFQIAPPGIAPFAAKCDTDGFMKVLQIHRVAYDPTPAAFGDITQCTSMPSSTGFIDCSSITTDLPLLASTDFRQQCDSGTCNALTAASAECTPGVLASEAIWTDR